MFFNYYQLCGVFSTIGGFLLKIFEPIIEIIRGIIDYPINLLLDVLLQPIYMVFLGLCKLLDLFELIAKKLAGMDVVYVNGTAVTGDLALSLLNNSTIWKAFASMLALGSLLLFITTFISVIRSFWGQGGRPGDVMMVVKNFVRTLVNFTMVPVLCFTGIYMGNKLLIAIDAATNQSGVSTASSVIFLCAAHDANQARNPDSILMTQMGKGQNTMMGADANAIDQAFISDAPVTGSVSYSLMHLNFLGCPFAPLASAVLTTLVPGSGALSLIGSDTETDFSITRWIDWDTYVVFPMSTSGTTTATYYNISLVCVYYKLTKFNYVIGIGACVMLISAYLDLIFGLIKRLYTLVTLFVISPPIVAMIPLDDGRMFSQWRQMFVGNVISAYSAVACINIYLILMGVFQSVTLFADSNNSAVSANDVTYVQADYADDFNRAISKLGISFANEIAQTFLIIGGAMFLKQIVAEVARLIGANDAMGDGKGAVDRMKNGAKKAVGTAVKVGAAVATAGAAVAAKGASMAAKVGAAKERKAAYKALGKAGGVKDPAANKPVEEPVKPNENGPKADGGVQDPKEAESKNKQQEVAQEKEAQAQAKAEAQAQEVEETKQAEKAEEESEKQEAQAEQQAQAQEAKQAQAQAASAKKTKAQKKADKIRKKYGEHITDEDIARIEGEYRQKIRDANAYNPIKNPIKARLRGMRERMELSTMKGLSQADTGMARDYFAERHGRREALRIKSQDMKDAVKIANMTGNEELIKEAKEQQKDFNKHRHGLMRNNRYWEQEAQIQQQLSEMRQEMGKLLAQERLIQANRGDTADIKRKIDELNQNISKIQRATMNKK